MYNLGSNKANAFIYQCKTCQKAFLLSNDEETKHFDDKTIAVHASMFLEQYVSYNYSLALYHIRRIAVGNFKRLSQHDE